MTRRHLILAGLVLLLIGFNLWRWWPRPGESPRMDTPASAARRFQAEDFVLKTQPAEKLKRSQRDLFRPTPPPAAPQAKKGPPPPRKTAQQLEEEAARAELAQIKLAGIVFREGKGQAYLLKGGESFMVAVGEKVGERFVVENINADRVLLKDPRTNVTGAVVLTGN